MFQISWNRNVKLIVLFRPVAVSLPPDGNIVLPGNIVSLTYFGRSCSLRVESVRGEDGVTLQRPAPPSGLDLEEEEDEASVSVSTSVLDSTPADLSLQLNLLTLDDEESKAPAASTPLRSSLPACSSTPSHSSHNPPAGLEEEAVTSPDCSAPTAPPGGAQSTDTFYSLSCSTKVSFRQRGGREEPDAAEQGSKVTYSMIGGLSSQLDVIRETIELPLKHPELFSNYGTAFFSTTDFRSHLEQIDVTFSS